jgi:oxygen-independent coproporphyrinogen-3 oxidase
VQSFDDQALAWMHRVHDARQAAEAARRLTEAGFDDWSLDLIFALPPELQRDWHHDLERALALGPTHVSCYGLTVEERTPLARWRGRGLVRPAADAQWEEEFLAAHEAFTGAGFGHYEVSNYARAGRQARHNSAYWLRVPYVGLGPGAHGFDGSVRRWNEREYVAWLKRAARGQDPLAGTERLSPAQARIEAIYLGLRSHFGVLLDEINRQEIESWRRAGWAEVEGGRVRLTATGWLRVDALAAALTDVRSHF